MSYQPDEQTKQDYIQNKLSAEAKTQFEMWLFDHPEAQQDIHLDLMMKAGLNQNKPSQKKATKSQSWWPAVGVAAALLLVVSVYFMPQAGRSQKGMVAPAVTYLSHVRSAEQPVWVLKKGQDNVLQIPTAYLSSDAHQVKVTGSENITIKDLLPSNDLLTVLIPQGTLSAGPHQLEVTNQVSQEVQTFDFKVEE